MAVGDVVAITVPSRASSGLKIDGSYIDVEIEGFSTSMDWNLGSGTGLSLQDSDFTNAAVTVTVTSSGYDPTGTLTSLQRSLVGTHIARLPYPNESSEDQATTASGARIRIWLDGSVYAGETATATISALTFVNTAGASETSNAIVDAAVVNNSTLDYPTITAKIDRYAGEENGNRVTSNFTIAVTAIAGHGVATVRVTATGRTSSNVEDVFVTSTTSRQRTATTLFAESHEASIPITGFQQGELIDCRVRVYPVIGDAAAIVDTVGATISTDEIRGRNLVTLVCDKDEALETLYLVSPSGSDSTGDGSPGNPYATIGKALLEGANVVELTAGKHNPGHTNTRIASNEWAVIRPADGETPSTVNIELSGTRTYRHQRLRIQGCTVSLLNTSSWLDGEHAGNHLQFRDCVLNSDLNGTVGKPTVGPGYRSDSCSFINCSGDLGGENWHLQMFSSTRMAYEFDGCQFTDQTTSSGLNAWFHVIACSGAGQNSFGPLETSSAANGVPPQDGVIFGWNRFLNFASLGQRILFLGTVSGQPNHNAAVVGNVFEKMLGTSPALVIAGDGSSSFGEATNNVKFAHNTIAGERVNASYNDTGSVGYDRTNWFVLGNSVHQFNVKADVFSTGNGNRTGGWPVLNGVECKHNHWRDGNLFPQEFQGFDVTSGSSAEPADPGYVDDQSGTSGAGFGDYTPTSESTLVNRMPPAAALMNSDLVGSPMRGDLGAIQSQSQSPVVPTGVDLFNLRRRFSP